jgi:hypothetical protein
MTALAFVFVIVALPTISLAYDSQRTQTQVTVSTAVTYSDRQSIDHCILLNSTLRPANPMVLRCSLFPSDDAFVDNLSPTKSFGDLPILIVQHAPSIPNYRNYAYLKFNLPSSLPADIVSTRAKPTEATLRMYVRLMDLRYNANFRVYRVLSNDWNESSVSWVTRPSIDPADYSVRQVTANGTWFGWNVTSPVDLAMGGQDPVSLAVIPSSNDWRNYAWFDSTRQSQTKVTTWPTLDLVFVEPFLALLTQHPHLPIRIGDQTYETDSSGRFGAYLPWGNYTISVPEEILKSEGVRDFFVGWSNNETHASRAITLGNNLTLSVNYKTQYRLDASTPYATINGSGWYYENTIAPLTIYPTTVPAEGFLGLIGVRHLFDRWSGDCSLAQAKCTLMMNGPKKVTAVWRDDYMITTLATASLIAICAIAMLLRKRRIPRKLTVQSRRLSRFTLFCGKSFLKVDL